MPARFEASRVVVVETDEPLPPLPVAGLDGRWHTRALVLARYGGRPVGITELELGGGLDPEAVAAGIWSDLGPELARRVAARMDGDVPGRLPVSGLPTVPGPPPSDHPATIVVATHDRPASLARCLDSIRRLDHSCFDVVVVDNAPSDERSRRLVEDPHLGVIAGTYVREATPGLARAHNAALPHVTGEFVAFTDDDVVVDRRWLRRLQDGFRAADDVACVTGMIFPAEIETPAQAWIEAHAGFAKGFEARVVDLADHRPHDRLFPFTAGSLGSGANMAFSRSMLEEMGGFDETLGVGTPARGGDDLAAFYDVVRSGHRLVYEPAALVHHHHHVDSAAVRHLSYSYGIALSAYLTRAVVERPSSLVEMAMRLPGGVRHGLRTTRPPATVDVAGLAGAGWRQRMGMVVGPFSYARSRARNAA